MTSRNTDVKDCQASRDEHDLKFNKLLIEATNEFLQGSLGGHGTTTYTGIRTRFDRIDKKKELIMRVCEELQMQLEDYYQNKEIPYYLGISNINLGFADSKTEYENGGETDNDIIECDIWEKVSDSNYDEGLES